LDAGRRSVHESEDEEDGYTTRRVSTRFSITRTTRQSPDIHFRLSLSKVQHANFYDPDSTDGDFELCWDSCSADFFWRMAVLSLTRFWINDAQSGPPEPSIPACLPIAFSPHERRCLDIWPNREQTYLQEALGKTLLLLPVALVGSKKKSSDRWVERTKRSQRRSARNITIKSIDRNQACTCVSGRPFSQVTEVCERARILAQARTPKAARCPRRHCASPSPPSTTCDRRLVADERPPSRAFRPSRPPRPT